MSSAPETDLQRHTGNQRNAADPDLSAWVAANAGAGKTSVLVNRVTRLLLAGNKPSRILCLTFTKAAAAEMALRLNKRLGEWAVQPDDTLRQQLQDLLGQDPDAKTMQNARALFAHMLEAPGGLRLQTVHAFCEALLKRFPIEARVPPHFTVVDEAHANELLQAARDDVLRQGLHDAGINAALLFMAEKLDDTRFTKLLNALLGKRRELHALLADHGSADAAIGALRALLGLALHRDQATALTEHVAGLARADLRASAEAMAQGNKTDAALAERLAIWLAQDCPPQRLLEDWWPCFFTQAGEPRKKLAGKESEKLLPGCDDILRREQDRLIALGKELNALHVLEATAALLRLSEKLLDAYAEAKHAEGLLDYDDLILKSRDLLTEPGKVAWVMFKLDQGIDHVLVDEAQDTSPDQWEVIKALADDFFSGETAVERHRTVFAVGDVKQSIYSFQGARPQAFLNMREYFRNAAQAADKLFRSLSLDMSFRSTRAVLGLVDAVFALEGAKSGVVTEDRPLHHLARRSIDPGLVEIWPPFVPQNSEDGEDWAVPLDYVSEDDPRPRLANAIAKQIKAWIGSETVIDAENRQPRPLRAGDVMILVRRRNVFFDAMVRELKLADVPVAGADRMDLASQIAVMDLLALAQFCLLPQDDLNLAVVLKGPLFEFDDDTDLFPLCHGREQPRLWHALKNRAGEKAHWAQAAEELRHLLARADLTTPFAFFAELLGAGHGRQRLLARLGQEANEPIDEFLAACLRFEQEGGTGLQGFVDWFGRHAGEVKRDLDQGRNEVRVLTVHGAKGLEAPVVILPDTCDLPIPREDEGLLWTETAKAPMLLWPPRKEFDVEISAAARSARQDAAKQEYRRLLYVALTRARDRLYVAGYLNRRTAAKGPPEESWYALIAAAFDGLQDVHEVSLPWGEQGRRRVIGDAAASGTQAAAASAEKPIMLPDWLRRPAPAEPSPPLPLAPSRPEIADPAPLSPAMPKNSQGLARGRLIHRLLQSLPELPEADRKQATQRFLAHPSHGLDTALQNDIATEVLRLLDDPVFAPLFTPGALAEAPIAGKLGNRIVSGRLDRLIVMDDRVLALDFKTDRPPPTDWRDTPPAYLRQMALYHGLLQAIFPGRSVRVALLWTHAPLLMELPDAALTESLAVLTA
ncbi:double-strand break repair helicase AddA [Ferrovibrio sp.]|uniref:double-strand break repair helicase AddA n=1 Tax=Ferrovibrio sp. TaxID=1917215 RepID=UPI0025BC71A9|nr:double-strand break repair helicase AddA [Ferrovibrio sp.]MBX3453335.1 double-strand break repair helicase AddA [Ferrovibrio sp.]